MSRAANKDLTIQMMRDGWQLGSSSGTGSLGAWLQRPALCCGGETRNVHAAAFHSLFKSGAIERAPAIKGDAYWLSRWRLKK